MPPISDDAAPRAQWRWVHGDPMVPFPPHRALGGQTFAATSDDRLSNDQAVWTGYGQYAPGDHAGCTCDFVLELA